MARVTWIAVRRWLAGLNWAATVLLLGVLFIFVNFVASRRYVRADLTKTQITRLSDQTLQVLKQLDEPVRIIVFYQPAQRLYELIRDLLAEYQQRARQLEVEYVDPEQDLARAQQLAKQFEINRVNVVVFEAGDRHQYLSDTELAEYDYAAMAMGGRPALKSFTGEEAFTSTILSLTQGASPLIWVTTGHGEKGLDDLEPDGLSDLKKALGRANMTAEPVVVLEKAEIPSSVKAVLVPGPTRRFTEQELTGLAGYLRRGGRLLVLLDPMTDSGLDGLLAQWGVEVGQDIVVDPARQLPFVSAANLFVTTYTQHAIVEKMQTLMTLFPMARSMRGGAAPKDGVTVTALAMTSPQGWGETQMTVDPFAFSKDADVQGPVSIAVAAEKAGDTPTRIVAIGDSDFAANGQLSNVGNADFLLGALHWLAEQEQLIGIGPKALEAIKLSLTAGQMRGLFWTSFAALPSVFILLGLAMWWVRRQ